MTDAVKLEPCPFDDGSREHRVSRRIMDNTEGASPGNVFWIKCSCGAEGPSVREPTEAIAAWNRRAGLEAVRREALEEAAKVADAVAREQDALVEFYRHANTGQREGAEYSSVAARTVASSLRALATNPQEGAAEVEGQVRSEPKASEPPPSPDSPMPEAI